MVGIVLGLVGRICAGKGVVCDYLAGEYDAVVFRFSDVLKEVLETLSLPVTRENLQTLGVLLRVNYGDGVLANALKKKIMECDHGIVVVDGVRYEDEVGMVKSFKKSCLVYVDAPQKLRYERCVSRGTRGEAEISFKEFVESDGRDTEKNMDEIRGRADYVIENVGSKKQLHEKIGELMKKIPN